MPIRSGLVRCACSACVDFAKPTAVSIGIYLNLSRAASQATHRWRSVSGSGRRPQQAPRRNNAKHVHSPTNDCGAQDNFKSREMRSLVRRKCRWKAALHKSKPTSKRGLEITWSSLWAIACLLKTEAQLADALRSRFVDAFTALSKCNCLASLGARLCK